MGEVNWKLKYTELKAKYMNAVDMAFRLGVEEGMKQSQLDQANQQLAQAQQAEQDAAAGGAAPGGDPNAAGGMDQNNNSAPGTPDQGAAPDKSGAPSVQPQPVQGAPMTESEHPEGSELDQHIATLEGMLKKHEGDAGFDAAPILASINGMKKLQADLHQKAELKKSAMAIPKIAQALHKPQFKFGVNANHNLTSTAKAAVSMQHKIVNDVMQKMAEEEKRAGKDILSALNVEGIVKGE